MVLSPNKLRKHLQEISDALKAGVSPDKLKKNIEKSKDPELIREALKLFEKRDQYGTE